METVQVTALAMLSWRFGVANDGKMRPTAPTPYGVGFPVSIVMVGRAVGERCGVGVQTEEPCLQLSCSGIGAGCNPTL